MQLGRLLVIVGLGVVVLGVLLQVAPWLRLGRLPGDVSFGSGNVRFYVPLGTSILLSVVLTLILSLFARR